MKVSGGRQACDTVRIYGKRRSVTDCVSLTPFLCEQVVFTYVQRWQLLFAQLVSSEEWKGVVRCWKGTKFGERERSAMTKRKEER